jgi:hypothetical protein
MEEFSAAYSMIPKKQKKALARLGSDFVNATTGVQLYNSSKATKKRKRKKAKRKAIDVLNVGGMEMVKAQPMGVANYPYSIVSRDKGSSIMAGNALTTPMRQTYESLLQRYRVRHKEFIADISGSVSFSVASLRINPANSVMFPWLSRIAPNFERYQFKQLVFSLKTQTSTSTVGSIMMAIDYDPTDPLPVSKTALLQYEGAIRGAAWDNIDAYADVTQLEKECYTAEFVAATLADSRLNDVGQLIVATAGQADTALLSELWVEYDIELIVPQAGPMCAEQEVKYSHLGVYSASASSGGIPIMTDLAPLTDGTYCYGISYTSLATGYFDLFLYVVTSSVITANGNITINGVTSSLDFTSSTLDEGHAIVYALNVEISAGDVVTVGFDEGDAGLFGYVRLRATRVDPAIAT